MKICLLGVFLFNLCTTAKAQSFNFDLSLIREWNQDSRLEIQPNLFYKNTKNNKTIWYLASNHTTQIDSPTFKAIEKAINEFKPDVIIVEGIPSSLGINHSGLIQDALHCKNNCSESLYAINLGQKNKIPFIGGEPDRKEELTKLKQIFKDKEIFFYYCAINLTGLQRENQLSLSNLQNEFDMQLSRYTDPEDPNYTLDNFKKWYTEILKKPFELSSLNDQDFAPFKTGHLINQISTGIDGLREKNILKTIESQLNLNRKVLVIYGSSHLYKHSKVLDEAFQTDEENKKEIKINDSQRTLEKPLIEQETQVKENIPVKNQ